MRLPRALLAAILAAAVTAPLALWSVRDDADAAGPGIRQFMAVSLSDCTDWNAADARERQKMLDAIGDHFGHASYIWEGARLPVPVAQGVFDRFCADRRFRAARLYKAYARALAWGGGKTR